MEVYVSDQLFSFGSAPAADEAPPPTVMMSDTQRAAIRTLFAQLGINDARRQFLVVGELTGTTIGSVSELAGSAAGRLIDGLRARIAQSGRARTGSAWDDREGDTWIDRL